MNSMIDEKHKEIIRENFLNWVKDDLKIITEGHPTVGMMYLAWIEATKQSDTSNSIEST